MTSRSIFAALLLFTAACRNEQQPAAAAQTTSQPPATAATATTSSAPADLREQKVDTTVTIPSPISDCQVKETFKRNEPIDFTMTLAESPAKLYVSVRVFEGDEEIAFVRQPAEGKKSVTLRLPKLDPGKYRLEGVWGGNVGCDKEIAITKK